MFKMFKMFAHFVCLLFAIVLVTESQDMPMTLPPLETLPPDMSNTSSIISPFDESCISADNSTDGDGLVYLGAVALNNDNECQVVCSKQILQQFNIIYAGMVRIRAVIIGNVFMASMPDNSTCAKTGTCSGGICSINSLNSTGMPETTTMMMNSTETVTVKTNSTITNSTSNSTNVSPVF